MTLSRRQLLAAAAACRGRALAAEEVVEIAMQGEATDLTSGRSRGRLARPGETVRRSNREKGNATP